MPDFIGCIRKNVFAKSLMQFSRWKMKKQLILFLFIIFSFTVYFNSLNNGFVLDDKDLIIENAYIRNPQLFPKIFISNIYRFSAEKQSNYYRPAQILTYALDYSIWKLKPFGYHLTNILLHAINSYLLYLMLIALFASSRLALASSLLYCVCPIHLSAVAYISGRADILAGIFMLASIIKFLKWANYRGKKQYIASIIFFLLALLSRESALLLPFLIILTSFFTPKTKAILFSIFGFFITEILYIISRVFIFGSLEWPQGMPVSFSFMAINALNAFEKYVILFIFPWPLYPMRVTPFINSLPIYSIILFLCLALLAIILILNDKKKIALFSFLWIVFTFMPLFKLIYFFPAMGLAMAENWMYIVSMGFFIIAAYIILYKLAKLQKILFIFIFLFYSGLTIYNHKYWKDDLALYKHVLNFSPNNNIARVNLANIYFERKMYSAALRELEVVLAKEPMAWDALLQMGNVYLAEDKLDTAQDFYRKVLMLNPKSNQAYNNLGAIYEKKGKDKDALDSFRKALEIEPENYKSYLVLGGWFMKRNLYADAIGLYKQALNLNPDDESLYLKIGLLFAQMGRYQDALYFFEKGLSRMPNSTLLMKNMGALYGNMAEFDRAIQIWEKVLKLTPHDEETKRNIQNAIKLKQLPKVGA